LLKKHLLSDHSGRTGVDLGGGNVLVPEYLGERLDGAAVAEIDGRGEGVAGTMEYTRQSKQQRTGID